MHDDDDGVDDDDEDDDGDYDDKNLIHPPRSKYKLKSTSHVSFTNCQTLECPIMAGCSSIVNTPGKAHSRTVIIQPRNELRKYPTTWSSGDLSTAIIDILFWVGSQFCLNSQVPGPINYLLGRV